MNKSTFVAITVLTMALGACGSSSSGGGTDTDAGQDSGGSPSTTECTTDSSCGTSTECKQFKCISQTCVTINMPEGTATANQPDGTCKKNVCDGAGNTTSINSDTNVPNASNPCVVGSCANGVPSNTNAAAGTTCGDNMVCNASGSCTGCKEATDCPGQESFCHKRSCTSGVCGFDLAPDGTVASGYEDPGYCKQLQCDGTGGTKVVAFPEKLPPGTSCSTGVCNGDTPSQNNFSDGTFCGQGVTCLNGACSGCGTTDDCPAGPGFCKAAKCSEGVCGFDIKANGSPAIGYPDPGFCKQLQCDGAGGTKVVEDTSNVPPGTACSEGVCIGQNPSQSNVDNGLSCGTNVTCDNGFCKGCGTAADCPSPANSCQTAKCTAGVCGFDNKASGTAATGEPDPGFCKKAQCDGAGNVVIVADPNKKPADTACTTGVCTGTTPSQTNKSNGVTCGTGTTCLNGVCTGCSKNSDCGTDTSCKINICSAGACGFNNPPDGTTATGFADPGNCKKVQCDGLGGTKTVNDDTKHPTNTECTSYSCNAGVLKTDQQPAGKTCATGYCNGSGTCVECTSATQCSIGDRDSNCASATCASNKCGVTNQTVGTALPSALQPQGTCKKLQCDGSGKVQEVVDNTKVPANVACKTGKCTSGTPGFDNLANGTACGSGVCSNGSCTGCITAANCTDPETFCRKNACNSGTCGYTYTANNTVATGYPDPGYCKATHCDGAGGTKVVNNDSNRPANTDCTTYTCSSGTLSTSHKSTVTTCTGGKCNGSGACVECLTASDCGTDSFCTSYSCSAANKCSSTTKPSTTTITHGTPGGSAVGSCKKTTCGSTIEQTDTTNKPDGTDCKLGSCSGATPTYSNKSDGTSCGVVGNPVCKAGVCSVTQIESAVSAGWSDYACGILDGKLKCWGSNGSGQRGDGTQTQSTTAVQVSGMASDVVAVSGGAYHTCALKTDGTVWCWGSNTSGQLGDGTNTQSLVPVKVSSLDSVLAISTGCEYACALKYSDGSVWCWGSNTYGQLGNGTTISSSNVPTKASSTSEFASVHAGCESACAVTTGGALMCWGRGDYGLLGTGNGDEKCVPTASPYAVLQSGVGSVSLGRYHACVIQSIAPYATLCFGANSFGQLGISLYGGEYFEPVNVTELNNAMVVSAGALFTCARNVDGFYCWGSGVFGQLGNNTNSDVSGPVKVSIASPSYGQISAGASFACAKYYFTSDSTIGFGCWGANYAGQLGNNSTTNSSVPVRVQGF